MVRLGSLTALLPLSVWLCTTGSSSALERPKFDHVRPLPAYQCKNKFSRASDVDSIAQIYYRFVNWIAVDWLSESFPVESLFEQKSNVTLVPDAWKDSLQTRRTQWLSFEKWWIVFAVLFIAFALIFTVAFAIYACCSKKPASEGPPMKTRKAVVGVAISVLIVLLFYTVFLMFGSSLYTKRGAEGWLPKQDKIDVCVEDVTLFINDMADTVEELAYNDLDATVLTAVVEIRDVLAATVTHAINVTMRVGDARQRIQDVLRSYDELTAEVDAILLSLDSVKENCVGALCSDIDNAQKAMKGAKKALEEVSKEKIAEADGYACALAGGLGIDTNIGLYFVRTVVDREKEKIQRGASQLLEALRNATTSFGIAAVEKLDGIRPRYERYIAIASWTFIGVSVFFFIVALIFLIGCTFETCGTKQEKGCCLRSTSATVYGVGTWIAILGVVLIAAAAALLAILAGNTANLVCDPLRRPMQRSDMVAVANEFWLKAMDDILREIDQHGLDSDQLSLMAVIKSCDATHRFGDFGLHAKVEAVLESLKHKAEHAVRDLLMHGGNGNIAENLAAAKKLFEDLESKLDELELKMTGVSQLLSNPKSTKPTSQLTEAAEAVNKFTETLSAVNSDIKALRNWTQSVDLEDMTTELPAFASRLVQSTLRPLLVAHVELYMNYVNFLLKSRVCKPLGELAIAVTVATCDQVIDPLNGVWHSVFSSLVFISVLIVLTTYSGRLARQGAKSSGPNEAAVYTDPVVINVSSAPLEPNSIGAEAPKPANAAAASDTSEEPQASTSLYPSVDLSDS